MSRILAFDCSGASCSAAVALDGSVVAEHFLQMERGQSEVLLPLIRTVLDEAGLRMADLDAIATVVGPGSFTGVRIGLAAARGLALAAQVPIVALTAFEAHLAAIGPEEAEGMPVAIAIDSRRGPVFAQYFDAARHPSGEGTEVAFERLNTWLPHEPVAIAGDAAATFATLGRPEVRILSTRDRIRAGAVARAAAAFGAAGPGRLAPVPLYLRPPDVTQPKRAAR